LPPQLQCDLQRCAFAFASMQPMTSETSAAPQELATHSPPKTACGSACFMPGKCIRAPVSCQVCIRALVLCQAHVSVHLFYARYMYPCTCFMPGTCIRALVLCQVNVSVHLFYARYMYPCTCFMPGTCIRAFLLCQVNVSVQLLRPGIYPF
jgi:hypothetical protein